jgi:lysophospholipase L1-like esterase
MKQSNVFVTNIKQRKNSPVRIALVGDSLTELTQYPYFASKILDDSYIVCNFGACGATVLLDSNTPYLYMEALDTAIKFQPDIAVILLGTNDADTTLEQHRGNFANDYTTLLRQFQSLATKPRIWIVKPPPIFNETVGLSKTALDREIIPAIEEVAQRTDLPLIDLHSSLNSPRYFLDGVHPNDAGARVTAELVCRAILSKPTC